MEPMRFDFESPELSITMYIPAHRRPVEPKPCDAGKQSCKNELVKTKSELSTAGETEVSSATSGGTTAPSRSEFTSGWTRAGYSLTGGLHEWANGQGGALGFAAWTVGGAATIPADAALTFLGYLGDVLQPIEPALDAALEAELIIASNGGLHGAVAMSVPYLVTRGARGVGVGLRGLRGLGAAAGCFPEGTLVATDAGPMEIENLAVGVFVWSVDDVTGELALRQVVAVSKREVQGLWHLRIGDEELVTTAEHPFWVAGVGWFAAHELLVGDELTRLDGTTVAISESWPELTTTTVYNVQVEGAATYFVGEQEVLVHNSYLRGLAGARNAARVLSRLQGVPTGPMQRVMARLQGLNVGGKPVVDSVRAFGSRAGSVFRGRGPTAASDLDVALKLDPRIMNGRNAQWVRGVLKEIATDYQKASGHPLNFFTGDQSTLSGPMIDLFLR